MDIRPHLGRLLLVGCLCLITACGFHLRGARPLPFQSIYLDISAYSPMGADLRRQIAANGGTVVTEKAADAEVQLLVLQDAKEKVILSLGTDGKVNEYSLHQRFAFKVVDGKGREVLPASAIDLKRDISFANGQVLAKEQEEAQIYRSMQFDLVQQLLRRLAKAPWPLPPPVETK